MHGDAAPVQCSVHSPCYKCWVYSQTLVSRQPEPGAQGALGLAGDQSLEKLVFTSFTNKIVVLVNNFALKSFFRL